MELENLRKLIFAKGKELGFDDMEISYVNRRNFSCKVFKQEIDSYNIAIDGGLALRGIYDGKMGYAYTEKIDETSIETLLKQAIGNAKVIEDDEEEIIFEGSPLYEKIDSYSEELEKVSIDEKINFLKTVEQACYDYDKRVDNVNYCMYQETTVEGGIFNTKGLIKQEKSNSALYYVMVAVKESEDVKSNMELVIGRDFKKFDAKETAKKVVDEALVKLGAKSIKSKEYPILLRNTAAAGLLEAYSTIFSATDVQKGKSQLKDKLGEVIASNKVTIIDDPLMKDGVASRSFDSEGVASKKHVLVEEGCLKTYLHNLKTAQKDGVATTGHAYKSSYKGTITVAPSNFYIAPGDDSYQKLVEGLKDGIMITGLNGLHSGVNTISGDFSLEAEGFLVKEGKVKAPINQITLAGNFYDLLKDIEEIGNDLKFTLPGASYIGSPTLKIKKLSVAGE
ncbi:TldD/PmbA family protein [Alkaliphilus hydrothermalis]|uniref:PmbA protein n=1 Tax=Alkaliphilus hydrothermalis TaxID=1482730 RepID=A0ABS2NTH5_9FIRM|nr:TldD/PmbA family protein [Alkaliphilus hydrothermalis]MBM7616265.1 PmbA protein [Alkaliphilus hydrothermalis]